MKSINTPFKILTWLCFSLLFVLNISAQNSSNKIQEEIIKANKKFTETYSQTGGIGVATFYANNAMILPPNSEPIGENDAIGKFWKGAYDAGVKKVTLETLNVDVIGSSANETGKYTLYDANDKTIDSGKYLVFWKKEKGSWKLYRDIWNSSMPAK